MTREWLETIRALAHKSTLGELLMIAPPGSAESDNMRRRLDLLADFAQHVVESVDEDELLAARKSREAFDTCSPVIGKTEGNATHIIKPRQERRSGQHRRDYEFTAWPKKHERRHWLRRLEDGEFEEVPATVTCSELQAPDRRTGPIDRRLTEQLVHSLVGGRMWQKQRLVDYGRRSTDKR